MAGAKALVLQLQLENTFTEVNIEMQANWAQEITQCERWQEPGAEWMATDALTVGLSTSATEEDLAGLTEEQLEHYLVMVKKKADNVWLEAEAASKKLTEQMKLVHLVK